MRARERQEASVADRWVADTPAAPYEREDVYCDDPYCDLCGDPFALREWIEWTPKG